MYIHIITDIFQQVLGLSWVDWVVTVTALVYVVLAARQNAWAWAWGIVSCGLWAYASYFFYNLQLDALLQIFYVVMGFIGLYKWKFGRRIKDQETGRGGDLEHGKHWNNETVEQATLPITRLSFKQHFFIISIGLVTTFLFGYFFDIYTLAAATYLDAFVTMFSVITTFILVQKKLDNWAYWVVIDATSVYLFASRGAYLFTFIMIVYTIIAANAFLQWRKEYHQQAIA